MKPIEVPSLAVVLSTLAYHASCLMTDSPATGRAYGCGIGGWIEGAPVAFIDIDIRPVSDDAPGGPWGVWAQVWLAPHGEKLQCFGNRCGGREQLVKLYAPVIAWVAAYHAAKSAAAMSHALAKTRAA